jgi:internalin A
MSTTSAPTTPKPKRRWLQYSLRTIMVLMLVVGCGLGWLGREVQRARAQREAAAAIEKLGGKAMRQPASAGMMQTVVDLLGKWLGEDLSADVTGVFLGGTEVSDAGLAHLRGLRQLALLYLDNTKVSDTGLANLNALAQLKVLDLEDTRVTDAGLVHLRGLTQLEDLYLDSSQVRDAGLVHLQALTVLQFLHLDNTKVSDAGLAHLRGLTQLRGLYLGNTQVTDAGVAELQKALPNVHIDR